VVEDIGIPHRQAAPRTQGSESNGCPDDLQVAVALDTRLKTTWTARITRMAPADIRSITVGASKGALL
jgi:hypothetical protein